MSVGSNATYWGRPCDRCHGDASHSKMSFFNRDKLCMACVKKEEQHPDYQRARDAEYAAVQAKDYNFPGVGWPGYNGRLP